MSSTHTGNPLCSAAALANIDVIESEDLVERAAVSGSVLEEQLRRLQKKYPQHVGGLSGKGLVWSIYLVKPGTKEFNIDLAKRVEKKALYNGLFMLQIGKGMLKIAPPLCIPHEALIEGVKVIEESIEAYI